MVYSTCSLSTRQNEEVVSWLLKENESSAFIVPVAFPGAGDAVLEGGVKGTVRFVPNVCDRGGLFGGGFFIAKIGKRK